MLSLLTLVGLASLSASSPTLSLPREAGYGGLPPFVLLRTPERELKAGHLHNMKLMLFSESVGNITMKFYNYTGYSDSYVENVLALRDFQVAETDTIIDIPIELPHEVHGTHKIKFTGSFVGHGKFSMDMGYLSITKGGFKTYVQTDKPIYKPGQPVRFRGFSVDSMLKGLMLPSGLTVSIYNPDEIKVFKQTILNEEGIIHQDTFLLAEEAKVGTYKITVSGRTEATCTFEVDEYTLPKFGVEIEGPAYIGHEDTIIKGKVTATYTYGKPVNGKLVMRFAVDNKQQSLYSGSYFFKELTMDFEEGSADWEVDMTELLTQKLKYLFNPWCTPSYLVIDVTVTDAEGGFFVEKTDTTTKFSQSAMKLSFNQNTQKNYVAGFPFYVELDVTATGIMDIEDVPVTLTMISGLSDLRYVSEEVRVQDGKVFFSFDVPEDACALKITAQMDAEGACDAIFSCFQPERMVAKSDEFIRLVKSEPASYNPGDIASYKILSSKPVEILNFVILSKGDIIKSWNTMPEWEDELESGKFVFKGSVTIPSEVFTRSRLFVFSANSLSGFLLADAIDLCILEDLKHDISIQVNKDTVMPGQNISLFLTSDPRSFVGISVNDASLELLREPCKVLTKDSTLDFLRGLDKGTKKDLTCKRDDPYQCKSTTKVKIIDIEDLLQSEGIKVNTNMNLFNYIAPLEPRNDYNPYNPYYAKGGRYGGPEYQTASYMMEASSDRVMDNMSAANMEEDQEPDAEEDKDVPRLRNFFPESWLWTDVVSDENGKNIISVVAPDTITGWKGNAFGISPDKGLGFSNDIEFKTFLPFFISLDLPYSGTVGERITIPVRIFNYFEEEITADVQISSEIWGDEDSKVTVPPGKARNVEYVISLTEAGNHDITVTARSSTGDSDAVKKSLLILPGGEKITETTSLLIRERSSTLDKIIMPVSLPDGYIPGSHSLKLVIVGDILGEAVSGVSNMIQLPSGCGEQNMHKVAINVFAANYLKSMYWEGLPPHIAYNIKHNLNIGIQQQLAYRRGSSYYSNGYSVFRGGDASDWLTAFVYKIVSRLPEEMFASNDAFEADRELLVRKITYSTYNPVRNGDLTRQGWAPYQYTYHKNKDLYWRAYFLISLLETEAGSWLHRPENSGYDRTWSKIEGVCNTTLERLERSDDCCFHHMVAYSMELCKQQGFFGHVNWATTALKSDRKCIGASRSGEYKFATCQDNLEISSFKGSSKSIEATAYAALYLMKKGEFDDSIPLIMWLNSQRSDNGGFRSSQDTVVGLQALAKFAEMSNAEAPSRTDLTVTIGRGSSYFEKIQINEDNKLSTKEVILSPEVGNYKIKWRGAGVAFVQMISKYHVTSLEYEPIFMLKAAAANIKNIPTLKVAFSLPKDASSTMYLLEIAAPTGLTFTKSTIESLLQMTEGGFTAIIRYDIKEGGQRLHLYINPMTKMKDIDLEIPMNSKFDVSNRMPVQVTLVNYYNPSERQTIFYSLDESMGNFGGFSQPSPCSLQLSCDILRETEAIVIGLFGESVDGVQVIDQAFPYKVCRDSFTQGSRVLADFINPADSECVAPLKGKKTIILLDYPTGGDVKMRLKGAVEYESALSKITECFTVITECPGPDDIDYGDM